MRHCKDRSGPVNQYAVAGYSNQNEGFDMHTRIARLFTGHPATVNETYLGHMAFAGWFAGKLLMAAGAALIHALLPFLFESTASTIIRELHERTHKRGR
jgi:hypothetical protein